MKIAKSFTGIVHINSLKDNKGITLVALVVTIIILIILAAISINILIGTDGLIAKTKQAKENIELATIEEQTRLNELNDEMNGYLNIDDIDNMTVAECKEIISDLQIQLAQKDEQIENMNTAYDSRLQTLEQKMQTLESQTLDSRLTNIETFKTRFTNRFGEYTNSPSNDIAYYFYDNVNTTVSEANFKAILLEAVAARKNYQGILLVQMHLKAGQCYSWIVSGDGSGYFRALGWTYYSSTLYNYQYNGASKTWTSTTIS